MQRALYGPDGFFLRERPADHFRTSVTASSLFADAVRELAGRVDDALGRPDPFDVVDVGAGRGELLAGLRDVPDRWRLTGVELAPAPLLADAPRAGALRWLPEVPPLTGLLLANEWLDAVPLDVLQDGRQVLVGEDGSEVLGDVVVDPWAARWWPGGGRVEVGAPRDRAWQQAVGQVRRGLAVAVDYGHTAASRRPTLTGYRAGRQVPPVPDGSCDLTAHVALDSAAAATGARVLTQQDALRALGVDAALPEPVTAAALQRASQAATLLDTAGLGGFAWLVQACRLPGGDGLLRPPGRTTTADRPS